jgi:hypothetical protein
MPKLKIAASRREIFRGTFPPPGMTNNKVWCECPVLPERQNTYRAQDEATLSAPPTIDGFPFAGTNPWLHRMQLRSIEAES